jgi:hypothetical protein
MSTVMRSARGASAFTEIEPSSPVAEGALVFSRAEDDSTHNWSEMRDELLCILMLKDNWDGEGTEAPHPSVVFGAIKLAQNLEAQGWPPAERIIASVNGTIYFEWHTPFGYQEIEVTSQFDAEYRQVEKGSDKAIVQRFSWRG